jgi:cytochrome c556
MKRPWIGFTVMVASVGLLAAACASTQTAKRSPAEYVEDRQKLMKAHGDAWKNVQDSAKAGNLPAVATNADAMANNAKQIPALFPEGSMTEKSKAKPEIWQKKSEFDAAAKRMETESIKLRDTARTGNATATNDILKDFGRNTCGSCHTPFRVPPPRQG